MSIWFTNYIKLCMNKLHEPGLVVLKHISLVKGFRGVTVSIHYLQKEAEKTKLSS